MTGARLSRLMERLGYQFKDPELLELALSHRSVGKRNNERLEFLGDSILSFVVSDALFRQFPSAREGQLSQMRAQLVKGETLAEIAREFCLGDFLILGPGEMKSGGHRRQSILADTVEALIGAIYIDSDIETIRNAVLSWFDGRLASIESAEGAHKDAKTLLQELLQARKKPLPTYTLIGTSGSDHQQSFDVCCEVAAVNRRFNGQGSSRRAAEQAAAQMALDALESTGF